MKSKVHHVLPYHRPPTVAFIDDDRSFLQSIRPVFSDKFACHIFDRPEAALEFVGTRMPADASQVTAIVQQRDAADGQDATLSDRDVTVTLSRFANMIKDPRRFDPVTVVVVDYDMPAMDGLQFCDNLPARSLRRILLTGKADLQTAIDAFNRGLIDKFIVKSDPDALTQVENHIEALHNIQAEEDLETLLQILGTAAPTFLSDPQFAAMFADFVRRRDICEHYLAADGKGVLTATATGEATLLCVHTEDDMKAQWEIASHQDAPSALVAALASRKMVPNFWRSEGYYSPDCDDWKDCLHEANILQAGQTYYWAAITNPPNVTDGPPLTSFEDHLDQLDREFQ